MDIRTHRDDPMRKFSNQMGEKRRRVFRRPLDAMQKLKDRGIVTSNNVLMLRTELADIEARRQDSLVAVVDCLTQDFVGLLRTAEIRTRSERESEMLRAVLHAWVTKTTAAEILANPATRRRQITTIPANRRGFLVHKNPRNFGPIARRVAVCEPNSDRSPAFCA